MRMPYWGNTKKKKQEQIIKFAGINYGEGAKDGELEECYNLSSRGYPALSSRAARGEVGEYNEPCALYVRDKLLVLDGDELKYDGEAVGNLSATEQKKQFATINTKVVIFPDKVYFDTVSQELIPLTAKYQIYAGDTVFTGNTITLPESRYIDSTTKTDATMPYLDGDTAVTVYASAVIDPKTGVLSFGEATEGTVSQLEKDHITQFGVEETAYMVVKDCKEDNGLWTIVYDLHKPYLYSYPDFSEVFKEGDGVEITGCADTMEKNNGTHIIRKINGKMLTFNDNIFLEGTAATEVNIQRKIPDLTCICQSDNRLWGAEGNTIYASALGDPTNFFVYDNLTTDSYAVAVGTEGDFTGCIDYGSAVLFWKEDCVHKVLGSYPAQYEVYTYTVPGIQKGSEKSAVVINETLFYKGRIGVYAYGGSTPELLTYPFGERRYFDAVAGTDGTNYYISMRNQQDEWELYVYDTLRGIWLREDETRVADFVLMDGVVYYIDSNKGKIMRFGKGDETEGLIPWSATFCEFDEHINGKKRYSRIYLRVESEAGAWIRVEVSRDGEPFRQVFSSHNERARIYQIPVLPAKCESFRLRISGKGRCKIKNMVREFKVSRAEYVI